MAISKRLGSLKAGLERYFGLAKMRSTRFQAAFCTTLGYFLGGVNSIRNIGVGRMVLLRTIYSDSETK